MQIDFETIFNQLSSLKVEDRKEAVSSLYNAYQKRFTREFIFKFKNSLNPQTIEDVIQESFIKIIEKKSVPKSAISIVGWLKKIITNTALDKIRQLQSSNSQLVYSNDDEDEYEIFENNEKHSTIESVNMRDCIENAFLNFASKHSEEFEIFSTFSTVADSTQKTLSELYGKSLSNIKKICAQTQKALEALTEPCME